MPSPNMPNYLLFFRDDMSLSTWILWGAVLQSLLVLALPRYVAILPACVALSGRIIYAVLENEGFIPNDCMENVIPGKTSFQIPNRDGTLPAKPAGNEVCIFIIVTRSNHPKGRWAPGISEITNYFRDMWVDVSRNRDKWGYLGKTPTLSAIESDWGNTMVWISYWRSLDDLHRFARGQTHRKGWDWYNKERKRYPHIAIQHETYVVPAGNWENIAYNFKPFGIGATKHVIESGKEEVQLVSPIQPPMDDTWKSMKSRMAMEEW